MNIKFAFAAGNSGTFEAKHFGDADKYLIYIELSPSNRAPL